MHSFLSNKKINKWNECYKQNVIKATFLIKCKMQCNIFVRGVINVRKKIETPHVLLPIDVGLCITPSVPNCTLL